MAVPADSYTPLTVTEVNSGQSVTVYNQAPSLRGRIDNLWSNEPVENTDYRGWDITLNKRMSNGWSLMGGASFGKTTGNTLSGIDLNNPNSSQFLKGIYGNDTPWSYKLSGVYELPFQITTSATAIYYAGFPELTTVLVNSQTVALIQTSQSVSVEPRGSTRTPSVFNLDLGIQRPVKYRAFTFSPRIDLYNLANQSTILSRVTTLGPAYTRAVTIQRGRVIKFGGKISF